MAQRPLTDKQGAVLLWIARYFQEHGYAPSVREIAAGLKVSSTNDVIAKLRVLEAKGWIVRVHRQPRSIRLLPVQALDPDSDPV